MTFKNDIFDLASFIGVLTMAPTVFGLRYLLALCLFPLVVIENTWGAEIFPDIWLVQDSCDRLKLVVGLRCYTILDLALLMVAAPFAFWAKYFVSWLGFPLFALREWAHITVPAQFAAPIEASVDSMFVLVGLE